MLLTVFYAAATWMQSRRLGTLRNKINQFVNADASIVFYKIPDKRGGLDEELPAITTSSTYCTNRERVMIDEVLHFTSNVRSCALAPKQVVNVENWITITDESPFPFKLNKRKVLLKDPKLFLLVEADNLEDLNISNSHSYSLCQIGIPRAWRAEDSLGIIIESDIEHLTKISSLFLSFPIYVDFALEISRIQTVAVEGKPCVVMKDKREFLRSPSVDSYNSACDSPTNVWSSRQLSMQTSPVFWRNQMELLRSFSKCATLTSQGLSVLVPEDQSASVTPGNSALKLDSEVTTPIPENSIEEPVARGLRSAGSECSPMNGRSYRSSSTAFYTPDLSTRSRDSSTVVSAQSTPSRHDYHTTRKSTFSSLYSLSSASTLSIRSVASGKSKPPNVLIYAESSTTTEYIKAVLNETLHKHKYTIYTVSDTQLLTGVWAANCYLLVICGNVPQQIEPILTAYLIQGGKMLCLCSSFLHSLLPTFRTAEVRERELVHFSYGKWQRVRLMHHVFCYQNSPLRTKFSGDSDESSSDKDRISPIPQTPSSVEVIDSNGVSHTLHVQVLGVEETWQTPSLLLAYFVSPGGRAVFSQVHLELDPFQGGDEDEVELRKSEGTRKEIIRDILSSHLGMEISSSGSGGVGGSNQANYTVAYFLGFHETKLDFLDKIKHQVQDGVLRLDTLSLKFCKKGETPPQPTANLLPVLVHSCPRDFSTVDYFENLGTKSLGRLLIYSEVLGSSMDLVNGELVHGFAVVPSQQTSGKGRTSNQWLSPPGCAMFSLQLHFPSESYMGRHPSVLQHVVSASIASALAELGPDYEKAFDLRLKWPNDLYTNGSIKVGGLIINCFSGKAKIICNVGCGINLDNEIPTTCLNKLIEDYNTANGKKLAKLSREKFFAIVFTQLEKVLDIIDEGNVKHVENLYYKYWLHGGVRVRVLDSHGHLNEATVLGIDEFGFLKVQDSSGHIFTVHPDGNSFDMMEGLIAPKLK